MSHGGCSLLGKECCGRKILANQPDFLAQKCWLEEVANEAGHALIFFPKFHCELNLIERVWSVAKGQARLECDYSHKKLLALVPKIMEEMCVKSVRRMAQRCYRYMDCYRHGLSPKLAEFAVKKYSSHRCIPVGVEKELVDAELIRLLAAEKVAAAAAEQMLAVQEAAEVSVAVADAAANPIPADVPAGVEPFSFYTVIAGVSSTPRTQFTHSNSKCEQCEEEQSATRIFERCERCNIVYHRTCVQPQVQFAPGSYVFLCDYPQCREEWDALCADPTLTLSNE